MRHGANVRRCSSEGCTKFSRSGRVCMRHGAKVKFKRCSNEGCTNNVKKGGVCWRHCAKVNGKHSSSNGCTKEFSQSLPPLNHFIIPTSRSLI